MIYTGRPERVAGAIALLESHGLHPESHPATAIAMPWVSSGSARLSVVVPNAEADEARALLTGFDAELDPEVKSGAALVGKRLVAISVIAIGAFAGLVAVTEESAIGAVGSVACCAVGAVMLFSRPLGARRS